MLLPYHTFEAYENGECGLLIPLLKDPPLIGANRYHANLYCLQMDVIAEFSKYSKELYTSGYIKISKDRWNELCSKNAIPLQLAWQIHDRWTSDGDDGAKFLEAAGRDQFTLARAYVKELAFLKEQGKIRIQASAAGKTSHERKKKKSERSNPPSQK